MNTILPVSAAANVYTPADSEYWPVVGVVATCVIGLPFWSVTPRSLRNVPLPGGVGVMVYGVEAGTGAPVVSLYTPVRPLACAGLVWPKNRLAHRRPLICAFFAPPVTLP